MGLDRWLATTRCLQIGASEKLTRRASATGRHRFDCAWLSALGRLTKTVSRLNGKHAARVFEGDPQKCGSEQSGHQRRKPRRALRAGIIQRTRGPAWLEFWRYLPAARHKNP